MAAASAVALLIGEPGDQVYTKAADLRMVDTGAELRPTRMLQRVERRTAVAAYMYDDVI